MPRKTRANLLRCARYPLASMRPRPDAAENLRFNTPPNTDFRPGFNEAAARCRGKQVDHRDQRGRRAASMRPRPDAAENPLQGGARALAQGASMRPRPDAAENGSGPAASSWMADRFNEAAARCRGKRRNARATMTSTWSRFNEAAARCRGKRPGSADVPVLLIALQFLAGGEGHRVASMRPRPDAAENRGARRRRDLGDAASMRPRPDAAENAAGRAHAAHSRRLQ